MRLIRGKGPWTDTVLGNKDIVNGLMQLYVYLNGNGQINAFQKV